MTVVLSLFGACGFADLILQSFTVLFSLNYKGKLVNYITIWQEKTTRKSINYRISIVFWNNTKKLCDITEIVWYYPKHIRVWDPR